MILRDLNNTVIIIDTDFIRDRISENLNFYKKLYPNKVFDKINLYNLVCKFHINKFIKIPDEKVDIIFAYTLLNTSLQNCYPTNFSYEIGRDEITKKIKETTYILRSFFGEIDESCQEHFINILRSVNCNKKVFKIIMVADNPDLNYELEMMIEEKSEKKLLLIKKYHYTEITARVKYINVDYLIAEALGLNKNEI